MFGRFARGKRQPQPRQGRMRLRILDEGVCLMFLDPSVGHSDPQEPKAILAEYRIPWSMLEDIDKMDIFFPISNLPLSRKYGSFVGLFGPEAEASRKRLFPDMEPEMSKNMALFASSLTILHLRPYKELLRARDEWQALRKTGSFSKQKCPDSSFGGPSGEGVDILD